jgi:hypothetical protein
MRRFTFVIVTFINLKFYAIVLSLCNDTMTYNTTAELTEWYFQHSRDSPKTSGYIFHDSLLQWPSNSYFNKFLPDSILLEKSLSTFEKPSYSIAEQVFGNLKEQQYIGLKHLSHLFYERTKLHQQHTHDINHSHMQIQDKKFCAEINRSPDNVKRLSNLENQLLQLEQQRRDEELAFWKDSVELRDKLFESAAAYKQAKQRYSIFSQVEGQYGI